MVLSSFLPHWTQDISALLRSYVVMIVLLYPLYRSSCDTAMSDVITIPIQAPAIKPSEKMINCVMILSFLLPVTLLSSSCFQGILGISKNCAHALAEFCKSFLSEGFDSCESHIGTPTLLLFHDRLSNNSYPVQDVEKRNHVLFSCIPPQASPSRVLSFSFPFCQSQ